MYQIGSVILIENQIFKNENNHYQIDHCRMRPSVIIAEDEDYFYYLTMSSKKHSNQHVILRNNKTQYIKIDNIYKKKIYGAIEVERLTNKELFDLVVNFYNYQQSKQNLEFKKIEKNILELIKKLYIKIEKKNKKKIKKQIL